MKKKFHNILNVNYLISRIFLYCIRFLMIQMSWKRREPNIWRQTCTAYCLLGEINMQSAISSEFLEVPKASECSSHVYYMTLIDQQHNSFCILAVQYINTVYIVLHTYISFISRLGLFDRIIYGLKLQIFPLCLNKASNNHRARIP